MSEPLRCEHGRLVHEGCPVCELGEGDTLARWDHVVSAQRKAELGDLAVPLAFQLDLDDPEASAAVDPPEATEAPEVVAGSWALEADDETTTPVADMAGYARAFDEARTGGGRREWETYRDRIDRCMSASLAEELADEAARRGWDWLARAAAARAGELEARVARRDRAALRRRVLAAPSLAALEPLRAEAIERGWDGVVVAAVERERAIEEMARRARWLKARDRLDQATEEAELRALRLSLFDDGFRDLADEALRRADAVRASTSPISRALAGARDGAPPARPILLGLAAAVAVMAVGLAVVSQLGEDDATEDDAEATAAQVAETPPPDEPDLGVDASEVVWTRVRGGAFRMGKGTPAAAGKLRVVHISGFDLARHETTRAQYTACVVDGRCSPPLTDRAGCTDVARDPADVPARCVTWAQADTFCGWLGGSLPTEAQWEYAARGGTDRLHPWGDTPVDLMPGAIANVSGRRAVDAVAPVGTHADGASPFGTEEMAGNVREWTADWYAELYPDESPVLDPRGPETGDARVVRGSSYLDRRPAHARADWRTAMSAVTAAPDLGFRCVRR